MASELVIRETILGILKSKDVTGKNVIHSSDFRSTISDLGFSMGSSTVENILVHCRLDAKGNLDFSDLERELIRERRVTNSSKSQQPKVIPSSTGMVSKPWRADVAHKAKVEAEKQIRTVTEHSLEVSKIYYALSHHEMTSNEAVDILESLEIVPTRAFLKVLQTMMYNDVPYTEFVKALTKADPNEADLPIQQVAAGGFKPRATDVNDVNASTEHKRVHPGSRSTVFYESGKDSLGKPKTVRKQVPLQTNNTKVNDNAIFKTNKQIKETLFGEDAPVALMSHNQRSMASGAIGEEVNVTFNSELRLQREQVYAALRKLDVGQLSMDEFQDKIFSMGIDIPETILTAIHQAVKSGHMDVRHFVKLLDATIFKATALEDRVTPNDLQAMQQSFNLQVQQLGVDSLKNLAMVFRTMDADNDGALTFTEFKNGCQQLFRNSNSNSNSNNNNSYRNSSQRPFTEEELRRLFNAFDSNGDGVLNYQELFTAIIGEISSTRKQMIMKAFKKLDRSGQGRLAIEVIADNFNPNAHPLVRSQQATPREVKTDLIHFLTSASDQDTNVSYQVFEQYFAALSTAMEDDQKFAQMMIDCFAISADRAPPPPLFKLRKGAQSMTSSSLSSMMDSPSSPSNSSSYQTQPPILAIQSHGDCIAWKQDASYIEEVGVKQQLKQGRKAVGGYDTRNKHQDIIRWAHPQKEYAESK
jgi:calcyphosin